MRRSGWSGVRVVAAVAAAAVAAAFAAVAAEGRASPSKTMFRQTVTHVITSPCGPDVALTSRQNFVFHGVDDARGGVHLVGHVNEHHVGTDGLGGRYVGSSAGTFTITVKLGAASVHTSVASFVLIRRGEAWRGDDKHVHRLLHLTVNAQGQVTSVRNELREICR